MVVFVVTGPTAVGKTELSLRLAECLDSPIINADSRQVYREMCIGTAAPTAEQMQRVRHYFVGTRSLCNDYNAALFAEEARALIEKLKPQHKALVVAGGSSLYIDALCRGIDDIPSVDAKLRLELDQQAQREGLEPLLAQLAELDPIYYNKVDKHNPRRVIHGLEICLQTGKPYSSFLCPSNSCKDLPFTPITIALTRPAEELYSRIDGRVDEMMAEGLEAEVRSLSHLRHLNALDTIGYRELFPYIDGQTSREDAVSQIKNHTHQYARKQLTWLRRNSAAVWFHPQHIEEIIRFATSIL